jgi:hypothetical protein
MNSQFLPIISQNILFHSAPESKFKIELNEVLQLYLKNPSIEKSIISDQDTYGKSKKIGRLMDKAWVEKKLGSLFPDIDDHTKAKKLQKESLVLAAGRPRMDPMLVYVYSWIRGLLGGSPKNQAVQTMLVESRTFEIFLMNCGVKMPGSSTVIDNLNIISKKTMEIISQAQLEQIKSEGLDNFEQCVMDSTSSKGNSERPTESNIIARLTARIFHRGKGLRNFGLIEMHERNFPQTIVGMDRIAKAIALDCGKKGSVARRKVSYNKLISKAARAKKKFEAEMLKIECQTTNIDIQPSRKSMLMKEVAGINEDISNLQKVMDSALRRVINGEEVKACDKVMSLSDIDVGCIVKGQRDAVFGYKPQLARSENGFISALIVPQGNAADSGQLDAVICQHISNTKVTPKIISADDGYSNKAIREKWMEVEGVEVFSISGSKGKKITPEEDWTSAIYCAARNNRSAVESLMFCVKFCYNFGRNVRRGIENVRQEMMEKVMAYNFARMIKIRQRLQHPA